FQAEDGIRDFHVTGVQTCALPIYSLMLFATGRKASTKASLRRLSAGMDAALPVLHDIKALAFETAAALRRGDLAAVAACIGAQRSEEHTSELQSRENLVCRLLLEK